MTGQWFSPGTPVSSTNKTEYHNITDILFKVALNTITFTINLQIITYLLGQVSVPLTFISYISATMWYTVSGSGESTVPYIIREPFEDDGKSRQAFVSPYSE